MSDLVMSGLIVGVLAMIFFTPFLMARGISKLDERSGAGNMVLCALPIVNLARAEKIYYGRFKLCTISPIIAIVCIVARFFIWRNAYDNVTLGTISVVLFWLSILFYFISNMIFVYNVINDASVMSGPKLLLFTIAYPFGQYYVGAYLNNVIRHNKNMEDTFKG